LNEIGKLPKKISTISHSEGAQIVKEEASNKIENSPLLRPNFDRSDMSS